MVLVCPQWDAIETAFKGPGEATPLASTTLPLALYLQNTYPVYGAGYVAAAYGRRSIEAQAPSLGTTQVHVSLFRDQPDQPQPSNRFRLRFIDTGRAALAGEPYLYCGAMQKHNEAIENAVSRGFPPGCQPTPHTSTLIRRVTMHLKGVTRGADMRAQPWWGIFVAVYGFEPVADPFLPEGFVVGQSSVQASCLLERPDDPQEPNLCRISALALEDGHATLSGEPVFYRSTIC